MMNPQFLTLDEVMDIHRDQIERYGSTLGVRDAALLESALAAPRSGFGDPFLHGDLFERHRPISFTWCRTIRFSMGTG